MTPPSASAALAMVLPESRRYIWMPVLVVISVIVSAAEAYMVFDPKLLQSQSGLPAGFASLLGGFVLTTYAACLAWSGESYMWLISAGAGIVLAAWVFVIKIVPDACKADYCAVDFDRKCPYSSDFNQNAIFHVILIVGVIFEYLGVSRSNKSALSGAELLPSEE
eukprot:TRINITY_DN49465_c0_g1_i1.p1 TRINITY_DN49465_c0_g1~~TRINITY_DN49465_c0_g1_i1.p1  ORF type:complete len:165 (+),score=19.58 TRINITY_DN49465_c0_g1_i1:336-830(+)